MSTWRDVFRQIDSRTIPWAHEPGYPRNRPIKSQSISTYDVKTSAKWLFTLDPLVCKDDPFKWGIKIQGWVGDDVDDQIGCLQEFLDAPCPKEITDHVAERLMAWQRLEADGHYLINEAELQHQINNDYTRVLQVFLGQPGIRQLFAWSDMSSDLPALRPQSTVQFPVRKRDKSGKYNTNDNGDPSTGLLNIIPDLPIIFRPPRTQLYSTQFNVAQASEIKPIRTAHDQMLESVSRFAKEEGVAMAYLHTSGKVSFLIDERFSGLPYLEEALVHIMGCGGYSVPLALPGVPLYNGNAAFVAGHSSLDPTARLFVTPPCGWKREGRAEYRDGTSNVSHLEIMLGLMAHNLSQHPVRGPGTAQHSFEYEELYDSSVFRYRLEGDAGVDHYGDRYEDFDMTEEDPDTASDYPLDLDFLFNRAFESGGQRQQSSSQEMTWNAYDPFWHTAQDLTMQLLRRAEQRNGEQL